MKILRFKFKTNNCEFRANENGVYRINDKRTKAAKQYKEFCKEVKSRLIERFDSCWTEFVEKDGCVLAVQVKG